MEYYSRFDSAPRTPSPLDYHQPASFSPNSKLLPPMNHPSIYEEDNTNYIVHPQWQPPSPPQRTSSAGSNSLLSELYYDEPSLPVDWQSQQQSPAAPQSQSQPPATQQPQRRATFPYVRQDTHHSHSASSSLSPSPDPYVEPEVKIEDVQQYNAYPNVYHHPHSQHHGGYIPQHHPIHHGHGHPQHHPHQHQGHHGGHMGMQLPQMHHGIPMIPPTMGISHPVQHTDDAASKETQFLRRRCFNCHTTEPPSWRRSTLNPGKIVCNKCGLYERTHLRPRPLRFDELRAGNKQRKVAGAGATSPPTKKSQLVGMARSQGARRSSVSSGGASSDWDDNGGSSSSTSSSPSPTTPPSLL